MTEVLLKNKKSNEQKHWVTLCLDGTVATEKIFARIDDSYEYAKK